jgi:hypothetical protein
MITMIDVAWRAGKVYGAEHRLRPASLRFAPLAIYTRPVTEADWQPTDRNVRQTVLAMFMLDVEVPELTSLPPLAVTPTRPPCRRENATGESVVHVIAESHF